MESDSKHALHKHPLTSDFPLARLSQTSLDDILDHYPDVEDIYPLSPTQEGMLVHTLPGSEPTSSS